MSLDGTLSLEYDNPAAFTAPDASAMPAIVEALDLGDRAAAARAVAAAEAAFAEIPRLAEPYCAGKWSGWYRGCKKLDVDAVLKKTQEVAARANKGTGGRE